MIERYARLASALALCAITYVGFLLYEKQLAWTIERKAEVNATAWLEYFSTIVPDLDHLLQTGEVTPEQHGALRAAKAALDVFRFKLFNGAGELTFLSDRIDGVAHEGEELFQHNTEAATVLRAGRAFVNVLDGSSEPGRPATYAEVYLPVLIPGGPAGVVEVYVDMNEARAVTEAAFARFSILFGGLALVALAIPTLHWCLAWRETGRKNAILEETARTEARLSREVRLMGELNGWLQSSRSQTELFELVVGFLTGLLPACEGEIYIYANSRDVLDGSAGWAGGEPHGHIHPEDCWSLRRGRTYAFGDDEIAFPCAHVRHEDVRPYYCLPLLAHGETIGLLHLRRRKDAEPGQFRASRRLAQLCAEQISMALANVRMRDELQDQSIRDVLTGLFNRRHLTDALRSHMARAAREGGSVAVLSIDVDHFKKFNDNYGHDAGDMVLRAVGAVLDRAVDGDELAARPGGEEFMVVLPRSDVAEALHRAESIRERIQQLSVRYGDRTLPSITVSIGIALSPADGTMPQDLMRAADGALYAAKEDGRNRAVLTTLMSAGGGDRVTGPAEPAVLRSAG
ncbi:sensor domain-containing diguanylate cyclase [Roseibacterium sp. SDUM158017]|uniref:sensor domain-containing diguanylate cyclase n=1 Tax=Roseicyclus salinarum TaxID=3036773 RepID=UPI002414EFAA|nr:sensor domain-containing diguanylate cyclase [Roseibacterium sp. SDUM158017]MDG4648409.1 sensor domain-containing diguanylate cyclase [Roseibacterium sp. SDUM158017]